MAGPESHRPSWLRAFLCVARACSSHVFSVRNPFQIVKPVVLWVSVDVVALLAARSSPAECFQDERMHGCRVTLAAPTENDYVISGRSRLLPQVIESSLRVYPIHMRSNSPAIADRVQTFVSSHRKPSFFCHDIIVLHRYSPSTILKSLRRKVIYWSFCRLTWVNL